MERPLSCEPGVERYSANIGYRVASSSRHSAGRKTPRGQTAQGSGQSLVTPHVERLPCEQRLGLNAFLKRSIRGQNRRVDFTFLQQQIEEPTLSVTEGQHR